LCLKKIQAIKTLTLSLMIIIVVFSGTDIQCNGGHLQADQAYDTARSCYNHSQRKG